MPKNQDHLSDFDYYDIHIVLDNYEYFSFSNFVNLHKSCFTHLFINNLYSLYHDFIAKWIIIIIFIFTSEHCKIILFNKKKVHGRR